MVWYDVCQRNCESQLRHSFSSSETSFEFSLLEKARMNSQRHAPCHSFTRQRLRSKPSTWSNAFALAIFIWEDKDRQTGPAGAVVPEMSRD